MKYREILCRKANSDIAENVSEQNTPQRRNYSDKSKLNYPNVYAQNEYTTWKLKVKCKECGCILTNPISKMKELCGEHGGFKAYGEHLPKGFKRG